MIPNLRTVGTTAFLLLTIGCYLFWATAGRFDEWIHETSYYNDQAEGFRSGHLHVALEPNAELLKQSDPLNPRHRKFWHWDYSLYQGHLYMYWGLAPAAGLALVKAAFQIDAPVGDEVVSFFFLVLRLLVSVTLVWQLAKVVRVTPPKWAVAGAMLVVAFANPTPFTLARGAVYEAAINGGSFFMTAGYLAALNYFWSHRAKHLWLALASLSFAMAGACRTSQWPGSALGLGVLGLAALGGAGGTDWGHAWSKLKYLLSLLVSLIVPYGLVCFTHMLVNFSRFGSWSEFGVTYQMGFAFDMGPSYLLPNLWQYTLHPLHISCEFPFFEAKWHRQRLDDAPTWLPIPPRYYHHEPVAGLVYAYPLTWFAGLSLLQAVRAQVRGQRSWFVDVLASDTQQAKLVWYVALVFSSMIGAAVPVLLIFSASMRYEADVMPGLNVLCVLAGWSIIGKAKNSHSRVAANVSYMMLTVATVVAGAMYGFTGYYGLFEKNNPALMRKLQETLSPCDARSR